MNSWLLPFSGLFPLILSVLCLLPPLRKRSLLLLPLAPLPALLNGIMLPSGEAFQLPQMLMGAGWILDSTARIFLIFTAIGWFSAALCALPALHAHPRKTSFSFPFLLAMSGNLLLISASDAVSFYTGFTVMGFASWGLIVHKSTPEAFRAGRIYLFVVLLGEFLVLPGLILGSLTAGSTSLAAIRGAWLPDLQGEIALSLLCIGFGLKAGLFPLHIWLPLAHPVAPTPASAVLSGCMIKTGLLAWLRLLPLGELSFSVAGQMLALLAAAGMIGGLLGALLQTRVKPLLAYTSLSKTGMMMLLLSMALIEPALSPTCIRAVLFLAAFHALHKGALFLGTGLSPRSGKVVKTGMILLAASYAGAPLLAGALAKDFIKPLLDPAKLPWPEALPLLLLIEAILAPAVLWRFLRLLRAATDGTPARNRAAEAAWAFSLLPAILVPLLFFSPAAKEFSLYLPTLNGFFRGDAGFWIGSMLTLLLSAAGVQAAVHIPPGDWLEWVSPPPQRWRKQGLAIFSRTETALHHAPGGVAFLAILIVLLGLLLSELKF